MHEGRAIRIPQVIALLALAAGAAAGCARPTIPGLQVRAVPAGFLFTANTDAGRNAFPDRELLSRGVWYGDIESFQPQSELFVSRYAGTISIEEARAAREAQAGLYGHPASIDYGTVAPVTIDGRQAYAWLETRYDERQAVRSLAYSVVIPYDSVSYALEFSTSAANRLVPDSLTRVVGSWGPGKTEVLWGVIAAVAAAVVGIALFLAYLMRR